MRICAPRFAAKRSCCSPIVVREQRSVLDAARRGLHVFERAPSLALRHRRRARQLHARASRCPRTARGAACSGTAAFSPRRRRRTARRRSCAASGSCRACSARRCRARRRAPRPISPRRPAKSEGSSATRCASGWRCTVPIRPAQAATGSWIRSACARELRLARPMARHEDGHPIDSVGADGRRHRAARAAGFAPRVAGAVGLFVAAVTERLMTYAIGRELEYYDKPVVRGVVRAAAAQGPHAACARARDRRERFVSETREGRRRTVVADAGAVSADALLAQRVRPTDPEDRHMRYLTKKHLSRRTMLRGAGVAMALPLARVDDPGAVRASVGRREPRGARRIHVYSARRGHGSLSCRPAPARDLALGPTMQSLEPFANRLNVVSGLTLPAAYVGEATAGANHTRSSHCWLTCAPLDTGASPTSADQVAARTSAKRLRCRRSSWRSKAANRSRIDADDAAADGDEPARRVRALVRRRQHARGAGGAPAAIASLLDAVTGEVAPLQRELAGRGSRAHRPLSHRHARARAPARARGRFAAGGSGRSRQTERRARRISRSTWRSCSTCSRWLGQRISRE